MPIYKQSKTALAQVDDGPSAFSLPAAVAEVSVSTVHDGQPGTERYSSMSQRVSSAEVEPAAHVFSEVSNPNRPEQCLIGMTAEALECRS